MQSLILYNETGESKYRVMVSKLAGIPGIFISEAKTPEDFEVRIKEATVAVLVLVVDQMPSKEFLRVASKNRNMSGFRNAYFVAVHRKFLDEGIQKSLMAGAKSIFLEPFDPERILLPLRSILEDVPRSIYVPILKPVTPVPCNLDVFGRVGKIFMDPLGDMQIEIGPSLKADQNLTIQSEIGKDLVKGPLSYRVKKAATEDIYYHYAHSYALSWQAGETLKLAMNTWASHHQNEFVLPKTKILWIGDEPLGEMEHAFNKVLFSLHRQSPRDLTPSFLSRLNPRIVIHDRVAPAYLKRIEGWAKKKEVLLIRTGRGPEGIWKDLPFNNTSEFETRLVELVKPFLTQRIPSSISQAKYLDRKSSYSRCTLLLQGWIVGVDPAYLAVELENDLGVGTIFYLNCPPVDGRSRFGFYLKVLKSEPCDRGTRSLCEMVPVSDKPELAVQGWTNWGWDQLIGS